MGERWEAPAKVNLTLRVGSPDGSGLHPLSSLVQTIEWVDILDVEDSEEDTLDVEGAELPEGADNLVWRAIAALGGRRPPLRLRLEKRIAIAAGLGGGSADAAAALVAVAGMVGASDEAVRSAAARTGADVTFFLVGGTAEMAGHGERVAPLPGLDGFAVAVCVPPFELVTADVYRMWDELGGPTGPGLGGRTLPPVLRPDGPLVNDLTPAAVRLRPELSDWMADLAAAWARPVAMSGSGPAVFAFFADVDEASAAAGEVPVAARAAVGVDLRRLGVRRVDR